MLTTDVRRGQSAALRVLLVLAFLLPATLALAALTYPALTGRVVDAAGILPPATRAELEAKLEAQETKTSDQFVVATVPSLEGTSIEDYANRLFRFWRIGQAKQDNGVLLLVAPTERKVRIEVGYGLEGVLTDAVASTIIRTAIVPAFRDGDMAGGVVAGAEAILEILNLDPAEAEARAQEAQRLGNVRTTKPTGDPHPIFFVLLVVVVFFFLVMIVMIGSVGPRGGGRGGRSSSTWSSSSSSSSSWGSSSSSSGGFSGGGGSSGGGGASGSW
ncbi:TPM domain-containing protein [Xanthobacteraceae bacterium A53D]